MGTAAQSVWNAKVPEWIGTTQSEGYRQRQASLLAVIRRHVAPCRCLDVGCGIGSLSRELAAGGFEVYGTDLSEEMIARAVADLATVVPDAAARFKPLDAGRIPFDGPFGLITAIGVFPYVPDHAAYIRDLAVRLAPGGTIVASCTNRVSLLNARELLRHLLHPSLHPEWRAEVLNLLRTGIWSGGHLDHRTARQAYSARAFDRLFAEAGFVPVDALDLFSHPRWDRRADARRGFGRWAARRFGWVHRGLYRRGEGSG